MKAASLLPLFVLALALAIGGCATAPTGGKAGDHMNVRTTAYTPNEKGGGGHCNACGQRLHFGGDPYSAAADWSWLPLGTRFRMAETGHTYVIEDYGSALVGKKTIDLYMPTRAAMRAWGARYVDIEILEWGSPVMSLKLLEPRQQKADYIRTMVAGLRQQGGEKGSGLLARE
jgi:3D (Asp-Asp-Asp) domain-containing protein